VCAATPEGLSQNEYVGVASARDDWDQHWEAEGDVYEQNASPQYRQRLIISLLAKSAPPDRILDIGSGQGVLTVHLARQFPRASVRGLDYSAEGVELHPSTSGDDVKPSPAVSSQDWVAIGQEAPK